MTKSLSSLLTFVITLVSCAQPSYASAAEPLANAPFKVTFPDTSWQWDQSEAKAMPKNTFLEAIASNPATGVKVVVLRAVLENPTDASLANMANGIKKSMAKSNATVISEANPTFLGYASNLVVFELAAGDKTVHSQTVMFITGNESWTISCSGNASAKDAVRQAFRMFSKKEA